MNKDSEKKPGRPGSTGAPDAENAAGQVGPRNRALGEIYQRLYPEMRRPKPNQEAIAAALQAMQRLTMEADSETAVEENALQEDALQETTSQDTAERVACSVCGHPNRQGNKFCGACGLPLDTSPDQAPTIATADSPMPGHEELPFNRDAMAQAVNEVHPAPGSPAGSHHYHHHYHHHYFQTPAESGRITARANAPESAREADKLRVAAAAKGEPMSRGEAAVRRLSQEWVLACNTKQLDELMELYAADTLVLRSNLPPIRGAMAVREFFFSALEAGLGEVALDPMRVEVSGDLAHEVGRYSALVPGTIGKRREERGKYLWVIAKQPSGDWKLVSECWSSDLTLTNAESDVPKAAVPAGKPKK